MEIGVLRKFHSPTTVDKLQNVYFTVISLRAYVRGNARNSITCYYKT